MAASLSLLRPRSRCSSTVNDGGSTKIDDEGEAALADLLRALHVDHQHDVAAGREQPLGLRPARAVEVAEDVGPFQELARRDHRLEAVAGHEMVVDAVLLAGPRLPRGVRPRTASRSGSRPTRRSATVVLPVPDGADTTNSRPR